MNEIIEYSKLILWGSTMIWTLLFSGEFITKNMEKLMKMKDVLMKCYLK